jgi:hypothetical protein
MSQNSNYVNELASHVSSMLKAKNQLQKIQEQGKQIREFIKGEESKIGILMDTLKIKQCEAGSVKLSLTETKRAPTATFKYVIPIIQDFFNASPEQMDEFMQQVSRHREEGTQYIARLSCRQNKKKAAQSGAAAVATPKKQPLPAPVLKSAPSDNVQKQTSSVNESTNASSFSNAMSFIDSAY